MTTETALTPQERIEAATNALGLSLSYKFVPFSMSRNKDEEEPSLNWLVTVGKGGQAFIIDYSSGAGYCPSYKQTWNPSRHEQYAQARILRVECEHGRRCNKNSEKPEYDSKTVYPKDADVINSLVLEASALDEPSFESWADNLGYDTDSRKAEAVYKACLEIALKLRAMIGDAGLRTLQEACQDY